MANMREGDRKSEVYVSRTMAFFKDLTVKFG